jgi:hypothetical protein
MTSRLCMIQLINIHMIIFFIKYIKEREVQKVLKSLTRVTRLHDIITLIVNQYFNTSDFVKVYKEPTYTNLHEKHRYTKTKMLTISYTGLVYSCSRVGHFSPGLFQGLKNPLNLQIFKSINLQINQL